MGFVSAGLLIAAVRVAARGALFAAALLAARALDPAGFGAYAFVLSYVVAAGLVGGLGLEQSGMIAIIRARADGRRGTVRRAVASLAGRALVGAAVVGCVVAALSAAVVADPVERASVFVLAAVVSASVVLAGLLRGLDRPLSAAVVLEGGRGLAILAAAAALHLGLPADRVWTATAGVAVVVCLGVLAWSAVEIRGLSRVERPVATVDPRGRDADAGQGTFLLVALATNAYLWAVPLVLERAGPVEEVGLFNVAMQLPALVSFLSTSLEMALLGRIAQAHAAGRIHDLQPYLRSAARLVGLVVLPAALILYLFREPALSLFGEPYRAASAAMGLAILAQVVSAVCGPAGYLVLLSGRARLNLAVMATSAVAGLVVVIAFAAVAGHLAAAAGFLVATAASNLVLARICVTRLGIDPTLRAAFSPPATEGRADVP